MLPWTDKKDVAPMGACALVRPKAHIRAPTPDIMYAQVKTSAAVRLDHVTASICSHLS